MLANTPLGQLSQPLIEDEHKLTLKAAVNKLIPMTMQLTFMFAVEIL
jgi:hypothetical protein